MTFARSRDFGLTWKRRHTDFAYHPHRGTPTGQVLDLPNSTPFDLYV